MSKVPDDHLHLPEVYSILVENQAQMLILSESFTSVLSIYKNEYKVYFSDSCFMFSLAKCADLCAYCIMVIR